MTAIPVSSFWISPEEYLEGELLAGTRHEYLDGMVYAMAGTSRNHSLISINLGGLIYAHLRGKPCAPFDSGMKVKIPPEWADAWYYPDLSVSCQPGDGANYFLEHPSIIFEIISPSTEMTDRREKRLAYRAIPSMQTYILVEQDRVAATVLRRIEEGWQAELLAGPDAILRLDTIGFECPLALLYERTDLL